MPDDWSFKITFPNGSFDACSMDEIEITGVTAYDPDSI